MKFRKGFISNSSSSSFALIGHKLDRSLNSEDLKDNTYAVGRYMSDGFDVFEVKPDMIAFIDDWNIQNSYDNFEIFTHCTFINTDDSQTTINKEDLPDGDLSVKGGDKDMHSSVDLNDLIRNYTE